jgi:hypothetical protein
MCSNSSTPSLSETPRPRLHDDDKEQEEHTAATRSLLDCGGGHGENNNNNNCRNPDVEMPSWTWEATDFKGLITLSAPFDLTAMSKSFQKHGLDNHIVDRIFGAEMASYHPRGLLDGEFHIENSRDGDSSSLPIRFPPMRAFHGGADKTVPSCDEFFDVLRRRIDFPAAMAFSYTIYPNWSHTDAIIEGPMIAEHTFHRDIYEAVKEWTAAGPDSSYHSTPSQSSASGGDNNGIGARVDLLEWPEDSNSALRPLCPKFLVQMGRFFMPF